MSARCLCTQRKPKCILDSYGQKMTHLFLKIHARLVQSKARPKAPFCDMSPLVQNQAKGSLLRYAPALSVTPPLHPSSLLVYMLLYRPAICCTVQPSWPRTEPNFFSEPKRLSQMLLTCGALVHSATHSSISISISTEAAAAANNSRGSNILSSSLLIRGGKVCFVAPCRCAKKSSWCVW